MRNLPGERAGSKCMKRVLLSAIATLTTACAPPGVPMQPLTRTLVSTEACTAEVAFQVQRDGMSLDAGAVRLHATAPGKRPGLAGTRVQAVWRDSIYEVGEDTVRRGASVFVWGVETEGRRYDVSRSVPVRCGEQRTEVIAIPSVARVYVSSDPSEASIFVRFKTGSYSSEERFVATTPTQLELEWQPGQQFMKVRVEKSGYQRVLQEIRRTDSNVRVILQPLPTH